MRHILFLILLFAPPVCCTCPEDYLDVGSDTCCRTFTDTKTQREAESFCEQLGGNLVQPLNAFVNAYVLTEAKALNIWLGMTCTGTDKTSCTFSNGDLIKPSSFANFYPGNPNPATGSCVYLSVQNGKWISAKCDEENSYACQVNSTISSPSTYVPNCGTSYHQNGTNCYKTLSPSSEEVAEANCRLECGHLTSILSDDENAFVQSVPHATGETFFRIGLIWTKTEEFEWTNGVKLAGTDYDNFGYIEPKLGNCVAMSLNNDVVKKGEWINTPCYDNITSICKRPRNKPCVATTLPPTVDPSVCSSTYFFEGNGTIYSPGYPSNYSDGLDCEYVVTASSSSVVFFALNTVQNFSDDASNISLYNSITDEVPFLPRVESGWYLDYAFYASMTSTMKMSFSSGSSNEYRWSANYTSVDISPSGCNQGVLQTPGMISSPNYNNTDVYRGYYPSQFNCSYQLAAPTGKKVRLIFYQFYTFNADDVLSVYDGPDDKAVLIGRYAYTYPPPNSLLPLTSNSSNTMFLQFTPRSNRGYIGFSAEFTAV